MKVQTVPTSLLLLLVLLTGCGASSGSAADESPSGSNASASPDGTSEDEAVRPIRALTCSTHARSGATLDFFDDAGGAANPEAAARVMAEPSDGVSVQEQTDDVAVAYLLRPDETAYMRLGLVTLRDGTWRVEAVESCPGEGPGN
jgi:hypothetical protein